MAETKKPSINSKVYPAISPEALAGSMKGRVVIITGAGGGLGRGESIAFAKAGAKLALIDLHRAATDLEETARQCRNYGAEVKGYFCDVTDEKKSQESLNSIIADLGPVDVLVNNAGGTNDRPLHMETFQQFWSMVDLNFKAPMIWIHLLINRFREQKSGVIINIASRSATVNGPFSANYAAAKAALVRAVGCIQLELDMDGFEGIDLYALHPGATRTNLQHPLPDDVAAAYPEANATYLRLQKTFPCEPALCGQTCVFLAAGRGKALKGKYFDCEQDIGYVATKGQEIKDLELYELKVEFLGGLPNDGGTVPNFMTD